MLVSGSGLLKKKKCRLSTGRSGGAFQIEVRAHDQRREFGWESEEEEEEGVLVSMMSMHVHTVYIRGYAGVVSVWCWCA